MTPDAPPLAGGEDVTLPIDSFLKAVKIVRIYEARWSIEVMIEYLKKSFGLDRFMVRAKKAINRTLIFCTLVLIFLMLARYIKDRVREMLAISVTRILYQLSVLGKELTVGKLREAISLDFQNHSKKWAVLL